jgi:hypothetical protein
MKSWKIEKDGNKCVFRDSPIKIPLASVIKRERFKGGLKGI